MALLKPPATFERKNIGQVPAVPAVRANRTKQGLVTPRYRLNRRLTDEFVACAFE